MLDIALLRKKFTFVKEQINKRYKEYAGLNRFHEVDSKWRDLTTKIQKLNSQRNDLSDQISILMSKKMFDEANKIKSDVHGIKQTINTLEKERTQIDDELLQILFSIPNIPHESVIVGKDEKDNKLIRSWGTPKKFNFSPMSHWDLAEKLGLVDFGRAVKLSGSRFTIYCDLGAKLIRALQSFTLDINTKAGYKEMLPPVILNPETLYGTGQLPKFEEDLFKLTNGKFLSPTAEVQLTSYYANEIIKQTSLPLWLTANTACFRSEAGSAGKDTKGVIRQHQFYKTEMVKIVEPQNSYKELETMVKQAESILKALKLPYRVIMLCTGDMGFAAAKTYDIEVWLPSYGAYKEISSCSNCEAYQARNLKMRYRDNKGDNLVFPHTLNGSGLAIDRLWAAVIENYQQADGSVRIPTKLHKYFDGVKKIKYAM